MAVWSVIEHEGISGSWNVWQ